MAVVAAVVTAAGTARWAEAGPAPSVAGAAGAVAGEAIGAVGGPGATVAAVDGPADDRADAG